MEIVRDRRTEQEFVARELLAFEQRFMCDMLVAIELMSPEERTVVQKISVDIVGRDVSEMLSEFDAENDGIAQVFEESPSYKVVPLRFESDLDIPILEYGSNTFEQSAKATPEERLMVWEIGPTTMSVFVIHELLKIVLDECGNLQIHPSTFFDQPDIDGKLLRLLWVKPQFEQVMKMHAYHLLDISGVVEVVSENFRELLGDEVPWEIRDELTNVEAKKFRERYGKRFKKAPKLFEAWLKYESARIYG